MHRTGENVFEMADLEGLTLTAGHFLLAQQPGTYEVNLETQASPEPNCDPSQGPCKKWKHGNYTVTYS